MPLTCKTPADQAGASSDLFGSGSSNSARDQAWHRQLLDYFINHRDAALAMLNGDYRLTRAAGSFLGQLAVDPTPMSEKQANWLAKLLEKRGLPPLRETGDG